MWNLKYDTNELIYKTERDSQTQKITLWLPKGKEWGCKLEVWDQQIQTTIYKVNSKNLQYSTENYLQYLVITYNGKESEKTYIYMCVYIYI